MKINNINISLCFKLLYLICAVMLSSCSDDNNNPLMGKSGYVQFKLYKASSQKAAMASLSELEYLNDAKKIEVIMMYNQNQIVQTLKLNSFDQTNAEYGIRSEKIELLAGSYTVMGYNLYDDLDEKILSGIIEDDNTFSVVDGGLCIKDIFVSVTERGKVRFKLVKDLSSINKANAKSGSEGYLFSNIARADIEVQNQFTSIRTSFRNVPVTIKSLVENNNGVGYITTYGQCDSILYLKAGNYIITNYTIYNKEKDILEFNNSLSKSSFSITDNDLTEAQVPVKMDETSENIKDYIALKKIWDALDGKNWEYYGDSYNQGMNWDFDKDIDLWGIQPGVEINSKGRVTTLTLGCFGPKGDIPAEIGQLTELKTLSLGTHNDKVGGNHIPATRAMLSEEESIDKLNYYNLYLKKDVRASFSEPIRFGFKEKGIDLGSPTPAISGKKAQTRDVMPGSLTNGITSIPSEISKLKKLQIIYIANGLISELPASMSEMESLTDLEVYNCPRMSTYPMAINTIKNLELINLAHNPQLSAQELYRGLDDFAANGASRKTIQIFYLSFNNLEEVPESFSNLEKIGLLDLTNNKISTIHPLGKNVNPVQLLLDDNNLTEIPSDADGVFCGMDDVETFSASGNKIKVLPNIFSARSLYKISAIDFSFNEIESIQGEDDGTYKGLITETLSLAGNKLKNFPSVIFDTGSTVSQLNLSGNAMESFPNGSLTGKNVNLIESLDLNMNKLSKLPREMNATTMPYLYGIDLSYNAFAAFPYNPLNVTRLTVYAIRHQRDAEGNRCLSEWPTGLYTCPSLRAFYIGGNDLRKIDDTLSYMIYVLEVRDNPNITLDVSSVCYYIQAGAYQLIYDSSQDIRGCDYLNLGN